jgi:peptide/nickel transport system ATP-binding protein
MTLPLLEVRGLARQYRVRQGWGFLSRTASLRAVDGVSFRLAPGRTLGLVGESGCGKSTTAKLVLGLVPPSAGEVRFEGEALPQPSDPRWRSLRRRMQMVFQDPLGALDRRLPAGRQIEEPLVIHGLGDARLRRDRAIELLAAVGLKPDHSLRYPHELSGGQRQRIVLARALALEPSLLVLDEPISALDVSIQAQVINLLIELQARLGLAYLFISHDLKVVRHVSHEVAVMYLGRIVEQGDAETLFTAPAHPYTRALVSAVSDPRTRSRRPRLVLEGEPPSPTAIAPGCTFHPRCPYAEARCRTSVPALQALADGRLVACHRVQDGLIPAAA